MEALLNLVETVALVLVILTVIRVTWTGSGSWLLTIFVALAVALFACVSLATALQFSGGVGAVWQAIFLVVLLGLAGGLFRVLLAKSSGA